MTIQEALGVLEKDQDRHLTAEAPSSDELDLLEEALGRTLRHEFRALLARHGGGILYERHEVFGARRLMVHDIGLVPDVVSFRQRFNREGAGGLDEGLVPFHRADGVVHMLDLRGGGGPRILSLDGARCYRDLACFLEDVALPIKPSVVL